MQVLVIGANGNTGTRIVRRLVDSPHHPVAMIRDATQQRKFDDMGVATVLGDLERPIDHAFNGCDAAIFAAGSGGHTGKDKTVLIDHLGAIRAAVAALTRGTRRFVMLSSIESAPDARTGITHYHRAKGHADHFLQTMPEVMDGQGLDYTILRPGGLTDEPGTGRVRVTADTNTRGQTSRDNLAEAIVACLDEPATIGKTFALFDGETAIPEALRGV